MRKKFKRALPLFCLLAALLCVPASAAGGAGGVASAIQSTWTSVSAQIKTVVNGVVFPALDVILVVALFCKFAMAFFDYRKHGQFEWTGIAILFACLVFTLSAPNYIWGIVGL